MRQGTERPVGESVRRVRPGSLGGEQRVTGPFRPIETGQPGEPLAGFSLSDAIASTFPTNQFQNSPTRTESILNTLRNLHRQPAYLLVNKVTDVGEDSLTQFYSQQPRTDWGSRLMFKPLKSGSGQIRLLPKQSHQCLTIGLVLVVTG